MSANQQELFDVGERTVLHTKTTCTPAAIGTGPKGETCRTCRHKIRVGGFLKCGLMERHWTHGAASDLKARWPACWYWSAKDPQEHAEGAEK
jgi:hypothetical protein